MRRLWPLLLLLAGCGNDLPPASRIDKLRVLAVQTDPPEVAPGGQIGLTILTAQPLVQQLDGAPPSPLSYVWLACSIPQGTAELAPCGVTAASPLPGADTGQAQMPPSCKDAPDSPLCVIGTDPNETFTAPTTTGGARSTQMLISVTVSDAPRGAVDCLLATANAGGMPQDPDHCVLALKRLTVTDRSKKLSDGSDPDLNTNPPPPANFFLTDLAGVNYSLLDGAPFGPSPSDDSKGYTIDATLADAPLELETTFDDDGNVKGQAYESLTVAFFSTAGTFDGNRAAYLPAGCITQQDCPLQPPLPDANTTWNPPTAAQLPQYTTDGTVQFWAVLRDDRGGVSWVLGSAQTPTP
jgi:hypothetical protein